MIKKSMALIGGSGALGTAILTLMSKTRWRTVNFDFKESKLAKRNILLDKNLPMSDQIEKIHKQVSDNDDEFDAMISVAGNFAGKTSIKHGSFFSEYDKMYKENVESSLLLAYLSANFSAPHCLILFTGDKHVFSEKAGNTHDAAYTITKMGTMATAVQLAKRKEIAMNCIVSTLLPYFCFGLMIKSGFLKTEEIMKAHPEEDFTKLLPLDKIANLLTMWVKGANRPDNGSFVEFKLESGNVFPYFV